MMRKLIHYVRSHIIVTVTIGLLASVLFFSLVFGWYLREQNYQAEVRSAYATEKAVVDVINNSLAETIKPIISFAGSTATSTELRENIEEIVSGKDPGGLKLYNYLTSRSYPDYAVTAAVVGPEGLISEYDLYRGAGTGAAMWYSGDTDILAAIYEVSMRSYRTNSDYPRYHCYTEPTAHPNYRNMRVFHLAFPIINANAEGIRNPKYLLVMTIRMDIFDEAIRLAEVQEGHGAIALIADQMNHVIYTDRPELYNHTVTAVPQLYSGYDTLMTNEFSLFGWKFCAYLNESQIRSNINQIYSSSDHVLAALLLTFLVLVFLLMTRMLRPIRMISEAMEQIRREGKRDRIPVRGTNEIWQMVSAYDDMLQRLELEEQEAERQHQMALITLERAYDAEREALESQINAHFICNTIGVINYDAIDAGDEKVSVLLKKLSNILRYSFDRRNQTVHIGQEIAWTEQYLYLQKERFEGLFEYTIDVDETYEDWPACKLMVQPFVENSILHGFENMREGGRIRIAVELPDDRERLVLTIEDNGCGIPEDVRTGLLSEISSLMEGNSRLDTENRNEGGIAIRNVLIRMRSFYGPDLSVELDTEAGKGTKFLFRLPYPEPDEKSRRTENTQSSRPEEGQGADAAAHSGEAEEEKQR